MEKRKTWLTSIAVGAIAFALYTSMLPNEITWANRGNDGGDFLAAILTGGIPHPTGYPTYMLLGRLFALLPFGSSPWRVALLSAAGAAAACGLLCAWVIHQTRLNEKINWMAGALAGLALATASMFWSQAVIVEVHGLQSLFVMLGIWWVTLLNETDKKTANRRRLTALALLAGIGLGNHVTLAFLAPMVGLAIWGASRRRVPKKLLAQQIGLVLTGLLVYLYLPIQARSYPPVNWGNPQTLEGLLWQITAQPYRDLAFAAPFGTVVQRITAWVSLLMEQFGIPSVLLGVSGAVNYSFKHRQTSWLLWWTLAAYSIFAIGYNTGDSQAYLLPAYLISAAWIGLGATLFWDAKWRKIPWGKILILAIVAFSLWRVPATWKSVDPRSDTRAADFAMDYIDSVPRNAILVTRADTDSFSLWYYHFGLGRRPDVSVIVLPLTQYTWYQETLMQTYPALHYPPLREGEYWGTEMLNLNPDRAQCYSLPEEGSPTQISVLCTTTTGRER